MNDIYLNTIQQYLPRLNIEQSSVSTEQLPLLYKSLYQISNLKVDGINFLAVAVKDKSQKVGPRELKKHISVFEQRYRLPVIWCLEEMSHEKVQRLIENGFNFIVKNYVVSLPDLNTYIKVRSNNIIKKNIKLGGLAINILITQVLEDSLNGFNKLKLSEKFNVSQVTLGRSLI